MDVVVGSNAVFVLVGSEGFHQDDIGHTVVCKHDVLVATVGMGVEATSIISEDVGEWDLVYGDRVGSQVQVVRLRLGRRAYTGTGGADVLSWLHHVPQVGLAGVGVVVCH